MPSFSTLAFSFVSLLALTTAAPVAEATPDAGAVCCNAQSCAMAYKALWTAVSINLGPNCSVVDAQKLIPAINNQVSAQPVHWTATPDGHGGSDITFTIPVQANGMAMDSALNEVGSAPWGFCHMA